MTDKAFLKRLSKSSKYPMKDLEIILDLAEIQLKQDLLNGYQKFRVCDLMFSTKQFAERRTKYFGQQEILIPPMIKVRISMSKDWTCSQRRVCWTESLCFEQRTKIIFTRGVFL